MTDKIIVSKSDFEHIEWIYKRLLNVHGENKNVDYMLRLKSILDNSQVVNSEPVAEFIEPQEDVDSFGSVAWLLNIGEPLKNGDLLYCTPQPAPDTVPRAEYDKVLEALKYYADKKNWSLDYQEVGKEKRILAYQHGIYRVEDMKASKE